MGSSRVGHLGNSRATISVRTFFCEGKAARASAQTLILIRCHACCSCSPQSPRSLALSDRGSGGRTLFRA